jgi:hypothetical protein
MNNLETVFSMRTITEEKQGKYWYADSREYLLAMSIKLDVSFKVACGVTAALSPMIAWKTNLNYTYSILKGKKVNGLYKNIDKAKAIKKSGIVMEHLKGPKVTSFFLNLLGNEGEVTIDTLMIQCYHNSFERSSVNKKQRQEIIDTVKRLAVRHHLTPAQVQAIIWVTWHRVTRSNFPGYVSLLKLF